MSRKYDLILFGATGYTGALTAQYLAVNAPTNLRWAIAGRSESKLTPIATKLNNEHKDRTPVETFIADLEPAALKRMAEATRCVISTVGPYSRYGTPVVEACVNAGTHYTDCTGEHMWVLRLINKYHETARKNGAMIVPQSAFESAPADLASLSLARHFKSKHGADTGDVIFALHKMKGGVSGGTIETFFSVFDIFPLREVAASALPLALSPVKKQWTAAGSFLPVRYQPQIGYLAPWVQAVPDRAIVMRSWGLMKSEGTTQQHYGDKFTFEERKTVPGRLAGFGLWFAIGLLGFFSAFSPFRWLARKIVTQPGNGPSEQVRTGAKVEWRAVGKTEDGSKKALARLQYNKGEAYMLTALMISEAALTMLFDDKDYLARKMGGGILTPACLGEPYMERLEKAGFEIDVKDI